jgi:ATP-dependent DNA helicase PIF1
VYPNIVLNFKNTNQFEDQAILCPTLEVVEKVNDFVLSLIPGESKEYLSADTPCKSDEEHPVQGDWFTSEFLNDIKCSGIPNHRLTLKVGVPIMLMRNIDQAKGLCNGTRMQVDHLGNHIISATVIAGKNIGDKVIIPRMYLVPTDYGLPFKFQRRQFPICLCFFNDYKQVSKTVSFKGWIVFTSACFYTRPTLCCCFKSYNYKRFEDFNFG